MSNYSVEEFIIHFIQALEDALEDTLGVEGMIVLALQVSKRLRKLAEHDFETLGSIEIEDLGEFVSNISRELAKKLGMHLEIEYERQGEDLIIRTEIREKTGTPAVLIPLTLVALALEEARQRAGEAYVISDAHISKEKLEFKLEKL